MIEAIGLWYIRLLNRAKHLYQGKYKRAVAEGDEKVTSAKLRFEYEHEFGLDEMEELVGEMFPKKSIGLVSESDQYKEYKRTIDSKLDIFDGTPFVPGALDREIDVVVNALSQVSNPNILEVGVANGYSTAFLYFVAARNDGSVTTIDRPKFMSDYPRERFPFSPLFHLKLKILEYLASRSSDDIGDIKHHFYGGVVPDSKQSGWLVPDDLRKSVDGDIMVGDALSIMPELSANSFDCIVLDAMKRNEERLHSFEVTDNLLTERGFCVQDGYWINPAFESFCEQRGYPYWTVGRIGIFQKI